MKLYIKNMVCSRCKMVVKNELVSAGLHPESVEPGEVFHTRRINGRRETVVK
jgi:hypothetical protein